MSQEVDLLLRTPLFGDETAYPRMTGRAATQRQPEEVVPQSDGIEQNPPRAPPPRSQDAHRSGAAARTEYNDPSYRPPPVFDTPGEHVLRELQRRQPNPPEDADSGHELRPPSPPLHRGGADRDSDREVEEWMRRRDLRDRRHLQGRAATANGARWT